MFKGFTLLCMKLGWCDGSYDVNRLVLEFVYRVEEWFFLMLLTIGYFYGVVFWYAAVALVLISALVVRVLYSRVIGHTCVSVEVPKSYATSCYERVYEKIASMEWCCCGYVSAFSGTDAELKYIEDYTAKLIREHINSVPMFENVDRNRYTGEVLFFKDRGTASAEWYKHRLSLRMAPAFHMVSVNVSYVYVGDRSYAELVESVLHERLHSMAVDESVVVFATLFLLLKYGTPEEKDYARTGILCHCNDCKYDRYDQYSYCVKYFDQYLERVLKD